MPIVATVHDLRFFEKGLSSNFRRFLAFAFLRGNLRRAHKLVTVSSAIKAEILRLLPYRSLDDVHVVSNASPPLHMSDRDKGVEILDCLGVKPPFLLYLGHLERRKNVGALIEAYSLLRATRESIRETTLVLAGHPSDRDGRNVKRKWGGEPGLRFLGGVSEEVRAALLQAAKLVVQPSRYEGFGLGVLEAMALGVPVACSRIPAHEEVVGEGQGLLFEPRNLKEMAGALARGVEDQVLRSQLIEQGRKRASSFSWQAAADNLASIWLGMGRT
jgi:alpha-1,3-rhamnosyl/mannosyltransferase